MYKKILVALGNGETDKPLIAHVTELAGLLKSRLLLVHVAEGFAARNFEQLKLAESDEMKADREYLATVQGRLEEKGLKVESQLALGNPPTEIVKAAEREGCDLIAMAAHGHRFIGDLIRGSTIEPVRHKTLIPVLVIRA